MTLADLKDLTGNAFAGPCYRIRSDEPVIVGKWCICGYLEGDLFDVWICNPKDIAQGLGQRRVRNIHRAIADLGLDSGPYSELAGEAIYRGRYRWQRFWGPPLS